MIAELTGVYLQQGPDVAATFLLPGEFASHPLFFCSLSSLPSFHLATLHKQTLVSLLVVKVEIQNELSDPPPGGLSVSYKEANHPLSFARLHTKA